MSVEQLEGGVARFAAYPSNHVNLVRGGRGGMAVDRDTTGRVGEDQIHRFFHGQPGDVLQ